MARTEEYTDEYLLEELKDKLKLHSIIRFLDVFQHTKFTMSTIYRRKLQKNEEIRQILEDNNIEYKAIEFEKNQDKIAEIRLEAVKLCEKHEHIFRIDLLVSALSMSLSKFYDWEISKCKSVTDAIEANRFKLKSKTYKNIFEHTDNPNANKLKLSLLGTEEERAMISTSYQKIDSKIDADVKTKSKMTKLVIIQKPEKKK